MIPRPEPTSAPPRAGGRPRVKICGLTRPADAALAAALGATHLGCVLVPGTPRCIAAEIACDVLAAAPRACGVLVFRGAELTTMLRAAARVGVPHVQLHGSHEHAAALEREGLRVLRVHRVAPQARELPPLCPPPDETHPALLDAGAGSGQRFTWALLGARAPQATFVAGGIDPGNLHELLAHQPWGIDVSSGVERAPGIKDADLLRALFATLEEAR